MANSRYPAAQLLTNRGNSVTLPKKNHIQRRALNIYLSVFNGNYQAGTINAISTAVRKIIIIAARIKIIALHYGPGWGRFLPRIFHLAHFHASNRRITADTVVGDLRAAMVNPRRHWASLHNLGCICLIIKYMEIRITDGVRPGWGELCFPHHSPPSCNALFN